MAQSLTFTEFSKGRKLTPDSLNYNSYVFVVIATVDIACEFIIFTENLK